MLAAIVWGLIQGLTEFLPISSSGHLVIVPALLTEMGVEVSQPSLGVSAVLHLGTLIAVLVYFRRDVASVMRMRTDREGRKLGRLVALGTIPIVVGLPLRARIEMLQENVPLVGVALLATGVILMIGHRLGRGTRQIADARGVDALVIGIAQAVALIPGISRSGITIASGNSRGMAPTEAARFSFLLGIPAIAGAGLLSLPDILAVGNFDLALVIGLVVATISGYGAIALLLAALRRVGLAPFSLYCLVVGALTVAFL